jgi:hypothetical protein
MRIWVGRTELDGVRSTSIIWKRFNSKKTIATGGSKLFRTAVLENVVNCTVSAPCTDRDVLEQIARQSKPIPIESLPDVLNETVHPRGRTLLGFCGSRIDEIARNYPSMQWWVSKNGLHMEVIPDSKLSDFDALAGRLMFEARPRRGENKRLPMAEYEKIARELDHAGFEPVDCLEGKHREALADWNRKYPRKAIKTSSAALSNKVPGVDLRRAVYRRFKPGRICLEKAIRIVRALNADIFFHKVQLLIKGVFRPIHLSETPFRPALCIELNFRIAALCGYE